MKRVKQDFFLISQFVMIGFVLFLYFILKIDSKWINLKFVETLTIVIFGINLYFVINTEKNLISLMVLFLMCIFIFNNSRILLRVFGIIENYNAGQWFYGRRDYQFVDITLKELCIITNLFYISLTLGYLFCKKYIKEKIVKYSYRRIDKKIGYMLFGMGSIATFLKVALYLKIMNRYGYMYLFSGNYTLPLPIRILDDFLYIGYVIILSNKIALKKILKITVAFLILNGSILLVGFRGQFFTMLLAVVWGIVRVYDLKIKGYKIGISGLIILISAQLSNIFKYKDSLSDFSIIAILNKVFYSQGVTILITGYLIEFKDKFMSYELGIKYLFSPIVNTYLAITGNELPRHLMSEKNLYSISDTLSYFLDISSFNNGGGVGSNPIAEFYSFNGNIVIFIILSLLLGIYLFWIDKRMFTSKYGVFKVMMLAPWVFWTARAAVVGLVIKNIYIIVLLKLLLILQSRLKRLCGGRK